MCMGPDDGCHDVPDPIAPIAMTFVSLEPTPMPIPSAAITMSERVSTKPRSFPCICPVAPCEGLAGLFVFFSPVEASGISIPGACRCICLFGEMDSSLSHRNNRANIDNLICASRRESVVTYSSSATLGSVSLLRHRIAIFDTRSCRANNERCIFPHSQQA
jgi:hypothetical protein